MNKLYLGIDPGRSKTGLALVDSVGKIVKLHIAESQNIDNEIVEFIKKVAWYELYWATVLIAGIFAKL